MRRRLHAGQRRLGSSLIGGQMHAVVFPMRPTSYSSSLGFRASGGKVGSEPVG